ncbi:MAG TPA: LPS export ABC transporter ATP-binding protein [Elusimicrobiota bacterium]|nr:LPS export ABC transporter ATP-binding protein [Elusimicrobiota bacterium]
MMLRTEQLKKVYGGRTVVNGVSLEVRPGEIVGLLGPNGAGKTTTFYMTVGLIRPDGGRIYLDEQDVSEQPMYRRARSGLGYLCQEPSVFRRLSVQQNLDAILEYLPMSDTERTGRREKLLEELGISSLRHQMANTLSGGEKRRTEIARALTTQPQFLLLDEPFVGIDPIAVADIQGVLADLKKKGLGLLITDHNVQATLEIVDRAYIIYSGQILVHGNAQDLLNSPEARRVYLGEKFHL